MAEHPIEGLMQVALENIKGMIDVNAIVGDPVQTPDGSVIIPISRVGIGFAAGGSDYRIINGEKSQNQNQQVHRYPPQQPFGGGSGGGVYMNPIGFLVVGKQNVQVVSMDNNTHLLEKIIDSTPQIIDRLESLFKRKDSHAQKQTTHNHNTHADS
ncbi:GerW family sporulation protein [Paenibacillus agilis]|uniref:Sporulation protein YtfJ n=1 Tax=Paenibacillus agilis TaxID=3020863 RepID=A0A559IZ20_9BACL|nr:GerW family sporulation protein [Paenibacillus agilis]TVX92847.1 sporulation protein YtfJ [Paenibacillus agilis]